MYADDENPLSQTVTTLYEYASTVTKGPPGMNKEILASEVRVLIFVEATQLRQPKVARFWNMVCTCSTCIVYCSY